jgi:hypothetical protein
MVVNLIGKFTKNEKLSGFHHMHKMQLMYVFSIHDIYCKKQFIKCPVILKEQYTLKNHFLANYKEYDIFLLCHPFKNNVSSEKVLYL